MDVQHRGRPFITDAEMDTVPACCPHALVCRQCHIRQVHDMPVMHSNDDVPSAGLSSGVF